MFHVICLETGEPVTADGVPIVYLDGATAASVATYMTTTFGKKHQPRRVPINDAAWQAREQTRLLNGTYTQVPWWRDGWWRDAYYREPETTHHYAHASKKIPGTIAYTMDAAKGAADIQTQIKPGRYLQKFYSKLGDDAIKRLAGTFAAAHAPLELKFAWSPEAIATVYQNGPTSCMSFAPSQFHLDIHPASVYGAGDLAIAYLIAKSIKDDDDKDATEADIPAIIARTVCWPEKKIFVRVYGDRDKLESKLRNEGYRQGSVAGARLLKIKHRNKHLICPYLDGEPYVRDAGKYLIVGEGNLLCQQTNGLAGEAYVCEHCEEVTGNVASVADGEGGHEIWCASCIEDDAFCCDHCGDRFTTDENCVTVNSPHETWCQNCFDNYGYHCDGSNRNIYSRPSIRPLEMADGSTWSQIHFAGHGFLCRGCGERLPNTECFPGTGNVCNRCHVETNTTEVAA